MNTKQIASQIVKTALQKGSKDNISVIVVKFGGGSAF
jgi:serine/threonine protein phosphatase PrpC